MYRPDGAPLELFYTPAKNNITQRYWYELDGKGNVVALTDISGKVVDRYHYDLWGGPSTDREDVPQPFRYAGYLLDREFTLPGESSGWYWLSVRPYDPNLKRFLQPDPSAQEGARSYVYAGDDPLDATDPSGLESFLNLGFFQACIGSSSPVQYRGTQQRAMHQVEQAGEFALGLAYQLTVGGYVENVQTLFSPQSSFDDRVMAATLLAMSLEVGPEAEEATAGIRSASEVEQSATIAETGGSVAQGSSGSSIDFAHGTSEPV